MVELLVVGTVVASELAVVGLVVDPRTAVAGTAVVGTAVVGTAVVGTAVVGTAVVGTAVVAADEVDEDEMGEGGEVDVPAAAVAGAGETVGPTLADGAEFRFGPELLQLVATTVNAHTTMPNRRKRDAASKLLERSRRRAIRSGILTNRMLAD